MDFDGVIVINKVIVHILNTKDNYIKLSDFKIDTNEKLDNLIIKHINKSIEHDSRRFAKFDNVNNIVKESSIEILNDNDFVENSKRISRELASSMKGTNASPANFLVAEYFHGTKKAVALLKLDFNDNFHTETKEENGKLKVEVKIESAGFNSKQKLQKSAFIYNDIVTNDDAEILILDKQSKENISNYFRSDFLNVNLINDDKINTKNMIREVLDFINSKFEDNPKMQVEKSYSLTSYFQNAKDFDINDLLNKVFDKEDMRNEFKEEIKNKKIDYAFDIDKLTVKKQLQSRQIITTNGISLKANASLFNPQDIDIGDKDENGLVDITIKKVRIKDNRI
ncbi:nucleoid-associated protein [Clostridium sp. CTA-1]